MSKDQANIIEYFFKTPETYKWRFVKWVQHSKFTVLMFFDTHVLTFTRIIFDISSRHSTFDLNVRHSLDRNLQHSLATFDICSIEILLATFNICSQHAIFAPDMRLSLWIFNIRSRRLLATFIFNIRMSLATFDISSRHSTFARYIFCIFFRKDYNKKCQNNLSATYS